MVTCSFEHLNTSEQFRSLLDLVVIAATVVNFYLDVFYECTSRQNAAVHLVPLCHY
jgi:hypothetical protein